MTTHHTNPSSDPSYPEPLPAMYDEPLVRLDGALSRAAAAHPLPEGLADRTFEASVRHLPAARAGSLKFVQPVARQRPMLSRLAMAASVGLAVLVGIVFLRSPGMIDGPGLDYTAHNGVTETIQTTSSARPAATVHRAALSTEQEWLLLNSVQLAHYSEVRNLSLADVTDDMAQLVRELEM